MPASTGQTDTAQRIEPPDSFAGSPYRSKRSDPHSSHSLILRLIGSGHGRSLLDVGAAHGYLAAALANEGFEVTGLEGDTVLANEAAKYCKQLYLVDLNGPLPEFARKFDVLVMGDVLEHLRDPAEVLQKLTASLKNEGQVVVSLPNIANFYIRAHLLMGRFDYQDRGILDRTHLRFFTRRSFRALLEGAGLEIITLTATPIPLPLIVPVHLQGSIFQKIHSASARLADAWQGLFAYQFVALAEKRKP